MFFGETTNIVNYLINNDSILLKFQTTEYTIIYVLNF